MEGPFQSTRSDSLSQDTGWVEIYETDDNHIRARRTGAVVCVRGEMGAYEVAAGAWRRVTTLPAAMAPDGNAYWRGVGVDLCLDAQGVLWAMSAAGEAVWSFDHAYPAAYCSGTAMVPYTLPAELVRTLTAPSEHASMYE